MTGRSGRHLRQVQIKGENMGDVHRFSEYVIDLAERLDGMADAAKGKGNGRGGLRARWLVLPAAGAGLYALATSGSFSRQAKDVMSQAKTRAAELPEDLVGRVRETSPKSSGGSTGQTRSRTSTGRKRSSARKTTSSAR
jgi:hypothetical protein